jgi:hypothetical protein
VQAEVWKRYKKDLETLAESAMKVKKARFERRVNGECSDLIMENLESWKKGRCGRVSVAQVVAKVKATIFCNKVILGLKIAILILGIAALIAFTFIPAGNLVIFSVFLITGIIWIALDLRGSAYWPRIRRFCLGDWADPVVKKTKNSWLSKVSCGLL